MDIFKQEVSTVFVFAINISFNRFINFRTWVLLVKQGAAQNREEKQKHRKSIFFKPLIKQKSSTKKKHETADVNCTRQ
jgi:hypothetical protein